MAKTEGETIAATGHYAGYSAKGNFDVELRINFPETQLTEAIQFIAGIGQRMKLIAEIAGEKIKLGVWSVYRMAIDKNAQAVVVFKSNSESAFVENMQKLMVEEEEITIKAKIQGPM